MPEMISVFLADGGRHKLPSGYGKNARSLIRQLSQHEGIRLGVQKTHTAIQVDPVTVERMGKYEEVSEKESSNYDIALQIGTSNNCRKFSIPSLIYCYCDTSDLPASEVANLGKVDGIIAPNRTNYATYRKYFDRVYLAHPGLDDFAFKKRENHRAEGVPKFSFIFVGSYSFRKGVDALVRAFIAEFERDEAHLHLHLPGEQTDRAANDIIAQLNEQGRLASITLSSDNLSEAWMARFYNRSDCYVTCSRAEGWGLPVIEAMLCELPVIAPFVSGMADYLNEEVAYRIGTSRVLVRDVKGRFAENFARKYGQGEIAIDEPEIMSLRRALRTAQANKARGAVMGAAGRRHVLSQFSEAQFGTGVVAAISTFLSEQCARATA